MHELTGGDENFVNRPANSGENRSGFKGVEGDGAREAKDAAEIFLLHGNDLDVGHLVLGNVEELGGVSFGFGGVVGGHLGFGFTGTGAAAGEDCGE